MRSLGFCAVLTVASMSTGASVEEAADYVPFDVVASGGTVVRVDIGAKPERARLLPRDSRNAVRHCRRHARSD
jgi:hypothetical protein